MASTVKITLAHPIDLERAELLLFPDPSKPQIEAGEFAVDTEVEVPRDTAQTLISAGYVAVDPNDRVAVASLLSVAPLDVETEAVGRKAVVKDRLAAKAAQEKEAEGA